ncbi:MAG: magnesium transporter [Planctomycetota bacterium]
MEELSTEKKQLVELLNDLAPDDRTAFLEELPSSVAQRLMNMLNPEEREITIKLLGYPEDSVGRLMTTDYVAVRPRWSIQETLEHIRYHGKDSETLNVLYVVNEHGKLLGDIRIRELLLADPQKTMEELMDDHFISLKAYDQEETTVPLFQDYDRVALPVTDTTGVLLGIVTIDDVLDVAEEEFSEDIQKVGGLEVLEEPYLNAHLRTLIQKRAKWLILLFFGEMLTATALGHFQAEISKVVVLTLFIPLIISSGGNSGSQATTLIIRSMAIGEITLKDWWKVFYKEFISGLSLGVILGAIGIFRVVFGHHFFGGYGTHWPMIALTIGFSLIGVVLLGTVAGSMLPFILKRVGIDPATSSAPFVATIVDVTGLLLYFSLASFLLKDLLVT